jgi:PAS domain S-box-containing protein
LPILSLGAIRAAMEKSCDTQLLSPRQVLCLAPTGSLLRAQIVQALYSPHYILVEADALEDALHTIACRKIEVLLFEPEPGKTRSRAAIEAVRRVDPDLEILVLAPRLTLVATVAAMRLEGSDAPEFDYIGTPVSGPELLRSVERARELRYLRRSEERGRRAEARMSAVVQAAPHAIISVDDRGTIHDWNPGASTTFGWSAAEAVGKSFWELAFAAAPGDLARALEAPANAAPARLEVRARRRDGREFPAAVALARVALAGRPMFCVILEDVGEARRMEIELRLAQKLEAVGRLASGLAHEINTPCQVIGLNAQFVGETLHEIDGVLRLHEQLRDAVADDPRTAVLRSEIAAAEETAEIDYLRERAPAALATIDESVRRVAALVGAMKHFAQADVDGPSSIDVNRALESTLTVVSHQASACAEIERRFGEVPSITGLPGDLNQALLGIVTNAIQAVEDRKQRTGEAGRIVVATRAIDAGTAIEVAITDNGPGIPEAIRHRIFDPFFTTREVGRGTGQGLSVARSIIVDRHGGSLTFESELNVNTTFYVRLPVSMARALAD